MNLVLLPDLTFPITARQADALMTNVVKLNVLDAGLNPRQQKALDILLDIYEFKAKTNGAVDYTGDAGHRRLLEHAMNFCGEGNPIVTRHGDLAAAHLAIGYHNAQMKIKAAGMEPMPTNINVLLDMCRDIAVAPPRTEEREGLFLSYLQKRELL